MSWKFVSRQFEKRILRFRWNISGFTLKKSKLGWNSHVDGLVRKILKHEIKVNNNPWWLAPASFLYDNLYWNNKKCFFFFPRRTVHTKFEYNWMHHLQIQKTSKSINISKSQSRILSRLQYIIDIVYIQLAKVEN